MVNTDNLISYWTMDEGSGNAADSHGAFTLTNTGVAMNQTGHIGTSGAWTNDSSDKMKNANITCNGNALAVNMWVYLNSWSNFDGLFSINDGTDDLNVFYNSGLYFNSWNGSAEKQTTPRITSSDYLGKWTMVTAVKDGSNMKLYLDGDEVATVTTQSNTMGTTAITIGNHVSLNRAPDGSIDEVSYWSGLSVQDITDLYNAGAGLAYPFDAGPDWTAISVNIGDVWKDGADMFINIGDVWKQVEEVHINIGDVWKQIV